MLVRADSMEGEARLVAGLELVAAGLAWHYKAYEREQTAQDRQAYAAAEETARARRLGLWADAEPVPPWEFRRRPR
ncbi:MAG: thermonuclease family protein [Rhodoferax sp.]|nr:thermonuclease family protein [Rhodoferax sp.]